MTTDPLSLKTIGIATMVNLGLTADQIETLMGTCGYRVEVVWPDSAQPWLYTVLESSVAEFYDRWAHRFDPNYEENSRIAMAQYLIDTPAEVVDYGSVETGYVIINGDAW